MDIQIEPRAVGSETLDIYCICIYHTSLLIESSFWGAIGLEAIANWVGGRCYWGALLFGGTENRATRAISEAPVLRGAHGRGKGGAAPGA